MVQRHRCGELDRPGLQGRAPFPLVCSTSREEGKPLILKEGDEALILAPASRYEEPRASVT